jgi:hypothetical protein
MQRKRPDQAGSARSAEDLLAEVTKLRQTLNALRAESRELVARTKQILAHAQGPNQESAGRAQ